MQLNKVIILKSTNKYYQKIISKCGRKMDLYLAMKLRNQKSAVGMETVSNVVLANNVVLVCHLISLQAFVSRLYEKNADSLTFFFVR